MDIHVFLSLCVLYFFHNSFTTIIKAQFSIRIEDDPQLDYHHEGNNQQPCLRTRTDLPDTLVNEARGGRNEMIHPLDSYTRSKRQAVKDETRKWPHKILYYEIDDNFTTCQKGAIRTAMDHIMAETCIRFVKWDTIERPYERYFRFKPSPSSNFSLQKCQSSDIGYKRKISKRKPPQQFIELGTLCFETVPVVIHELMHLLGVEHTMRRPDRDQYINFHLKYVYPTALSVFTANENLTSYGLPYDYNSIMQYPNLGGSNLGDPAFFTMSWKKDPLHVCLGQHLFPTECDWELLRLMYRCFGRQGRCKLTPFNYLDKSVNIKYACKSYALFDDPDQ